MATVFDGCARLSALTFASAVALSAHAMAAETLSQQQLIDRVTHQDEEIAALKAQIDRLTKLVTGESGTYAAGASKSSTRVSAETAAATEGRLRVLEDKVGEQGKILSARATSPEQKSDDGKVVMTGPLPKFESANGNFTAGLRALVQYDMGYYMQNDVPAGAPGPDLNSGSNFRRARVGIEGTLYKVWSYNLTGEFGGSGSEQPVQIQQAYVQYSGFKPFAFRVGAFAPFASLEDSTSTGDLLFLERADASEITRGIAGGDGRYGVSLVAQGSRYLASLAYTGSKVNASSSATAQTFDEQQALVGRLAGLVYTNKTTNIVLGANGTYVFDSADAAPGSAGGGAFSFSNAPGLRVDDTGTNNAPASLVSTGAISARQAWHWGVDGAAQWKSLYGEGGYFKFGSTRYGAGTPANGNPSFDSWYAQLSWIIGGGSRRYNASSGSFRAPKVANPVGFGAGSGWGAWEIAGRYSVSDLNFDAGLAGAATPAGGIRGGEQTIETIGVNWYPNDALRFSANYLIVNVDRLNGAGAQIGQDFQAIALRSQLGF